MSRWSRRAFLGGAATMLALPFLETIARGNPGAPPTHPTRLLFYFVPNGVIPDTYDPTPYGPHWVAKDILKPLQAHKKEITVFSNMSSLGYVGGTGPHTKATGTFLTCTPIIENYTGQVSGGISIDQIAAMHLGANTRFPSLQLGALTKPLTGFCEESYSCAYLQTISWSGPSTPLPKLTDPQAVYELLCSGYDPKQAQAAAAYRLAREKSVLDAVYNEAKSLRGWLSSADKYRMDEYLDGVRALEQQVFKPAAECPPGSKPAQGFDIETRMKVMTDLMVLALKTNQTQVISFMQDDGFAATVYDFLGLNDGHHWYTHHEGDVDMMAAVKAITTWQVKQFAYLLDRMRSTPEGEGTLLDHSLVMFGNSMSECNNHKNDNVPTILAGRGNGAVEPGLSIQLAPGTPRANLYISMLHAVGIELDSFGSHGDGPLVELMTG